MFVENSDLSDYYCYARDEVFAVVPQNACRVLDIGCGAGVLGARVRERNKAEVIGIERNEKAASQARRSLDKVLLADVEAIDFAKVFGTRMFDCVIVADVIEHLNNPWLLLSQIHKVLTDDGVLVVSVPNIRHWRIARALIFRGRWDYEDQGILDRTHLRFFTRATLHDALSHAGFSIMSSSLLQAPWDRNRPFQKLGWRLMRGKARELLAYQLLVCAQKINKDLHEQ